MKRITPTVLLALVLAALVADITVRTLPVHAQNPNMVYIDVVHKIGKQTAPLTTRGASVIGFSCANQYGRGSGVDCYVLSK